MTDKHKLDNRSNQLNPTHPQYWRDRGYSEEQAASLANAQGLQLDEDDDYADSWDHFLSDDKD